MKRALKAVGFTVAVVIVLIVGGALFVHFDGIPKYPVEKVELKAEPTPERLARGKKLVTVLCAGCHMDPKTQLLTGKHMADAPPEFGPIYSKNITQHPVKGIGTWTDGELAYLLRTGVARTGQYIPPYMVKLPHLADEDLLSIIAFLRSNDPLVAAVDVDPPGKTQPSFLTKLLSHLVFKKLPYPTHPIPMPAATDKVAHGRYLVMALECYGCHSADFKKMNVAEPEKSAGYLGGGNALRDLQGEVIFSANLTSDEETGTGKWTEADFKRALREGFRPNGKLVRYPMQPLPELTDEEISALWAYLRSVPKIRNAVDRKEEALVPVAAAGAPSGGKALYYKYGCVSCHGETGIGIADLRQATEHYPTDDALKDWIKNAPRIKPGTKMPAWEGIIAEADYPPLIAYVRSLGGKAAPAP